MKIIVKKQIIIIGGGTTFDTYEEYIFYLKNKEVDIDFFKAKIKWKDTLAEKLGTDFEIISPKMPNVTSARYEEWKIWFEKFFPFINDEVILTGHSLGGIFLAKYLSENLFPKKIKAVILVAAPFDTENAIESLGSFVLGKTLEKFENQTSKIYLFHSEDDPVVPFEQVNKYKKSLPNSEMIVFKNKQHFNHEFFPEIVELIKNI